MTERAAQNVLLFYMLYLVEAVRHEVVLQLVHLLLRAALLVLAGHEALRRER